MSGQLVGSMKLALAVMSIGTCLTVEEIESGVACVADIDDFLRLVGSSGSGLRLNVCIHL